MGDPDRTLWVAASRVAKLFAFAAMAARLRMLAHDSPVVGLMVQRDVLFSETAMLERELAIVRGQRRRKPAKQRAHFLPEE
ncbi:MAG: hypothetical protein AAGB51_04875 [Planctomycetota bacterium]